MGYIYITPENLFKLRKTIEQIMARRYEGFTKLEQEIIENCPVADTGKYEVIPDGDQYKIEIHTIEQNLAHENTWIPFMAHFVTGVMKADDGMDGYWCVRFRGDGLFAYYEATFEYKQMHLWTPEGIKNTIDNLMR